MSMMTLRAKATGGIPLEIIKLASQIGANVGDQDITVTIHDETTGREYTLSPEGRSED